MKLTLSLLAVAGIALTVPALADEPRAPSSDPATEAAAAEQTTDQASEAPEAAADAEPAAPAPVPAAIELPAIEAPEEEERICRRIRTDASSRRATRVCLTREGWRELNQRR